MPGNIIPESQILISSISWKIRLENFFKKNWYFVVVAFIILLPILIILFNKTTIRTVKILPTPAPIPDNKLICPTTKELCAEGKDIKITNNTHGLGIDIAKGNTIYAVFDGQLTTGVMTNKSGQGFLVLSLMNPQMSKQAVYWYRGTEGKPGMVKEGDQLATASGEIMPSADNNKFVFMLFDTTSGKSIPTKSEDFK